MIAFDPRPSARGDRPLAQITLRDRATTLTLAERGWTAFVREAWNRRAALIERPNSAPLLPATEAFELLVDAGRAWRSGRMVATMRVLVEDRAIAAGARSYTEVRPTHLAPFLARPEDGTLQRYGKRIETQLGGRRFGVVLGQYDRTSPEHWLRVRAFARPLLARVGIPAGGLEVDIFMGNYEATPFGLHVDQEHIFTWSVAGTKRFVTGLDQPAFTEAARYQHILDYEALRDRLDDVELDERRADILYWAPAHWHSAEQGGRELSATASIGIDLRAATERMIFDELRARAGGVRGPLDLELYASGRDGRLPREHRARLKALRTVEPDELAEAVERRWLVFASALGTTPVPPRDRADVLPPDAQIGLTPGGCILVRVRRDRLLVAVNGHLFELPRARPVERLARALADGAIGTAEGLAAWYAGRSVSPDGLLAFLSTVYRARGIARR